MIETVARRRHLPRLSWLVFGTVSELWKAAMCEIVWAQNNFSDEKWQNRGCWVGFDRIPVACGV